jgi:C-terminal processing protease CtpA/Prc
MQKKSLLTALSFLLTGFVAAYFVFTYHTPGDSASDSLAAPSADDAPVPNPFIVKNDVVLKPDRLTSLENEVAAIKQQLQQINNTLQKLTESSSSAASSHESSEQTINRPGNRSGNQNRYSSALTRRLYSLDNLIRGGIGAAQAEDIVRRKNSIELQRLALQDRATRDGYLNSRRYYDELAEINKQDVSLREELGDDRYDQYLYDSKQNNRIRIASVMLGSAAEQAGIQKGDIILSYDNHRMFSWQELKDATSEGQLGEYVAINIYRNGEIYSFSVPRGPLGMQLGASRLAP